MRRVSTRLALSAALAVSVLGISAVGATAKAPSSTKTKSHFVLVKGGTTTITVTTATAKFLTSHGVTVTPIAPAVISGTSLTLPVKAGLAKVDKKVDGVLFQAGAVRFSTATKSATVRHITLYKLGKQAHLAGTVDGRALRLGNITDLVVAVSGKSATVSGELHLSAAVAHIINKLLGHHVVSAGYEFGSFTSSLTVK